MGKGLLSGRPSAREWTVRLCILGVIVDMASAAIFLYNKDSIELRRSEVWILMAGILLQVSMALVLFVALRRSDVRAWFAELGAETTSSAAWITPLVCLGILLATGDVARNYSTEASFESLYPVRTRFRFRHGKTWQPLESIGYSGPILTSTVKEEDPLRPTHCDVGLRLARRLWVGG